MTKWENPQGTLENGDISQVSSPPLYLYFLILQNRSHSNLTFFWPQN